ncbi:sigma-70 family RNA polymerase sigma factor [Streptomyces sp. ISL-43]|uniref:RNA polymerase sigma factor n=1 Tax=Streptomyces sp. ISL-43 TaxID=2819183 RepID=UPI001BEBEF30|nr:sigma-70 family RNA polymerase sigma factor [Streptomyces sp. ISL-43]MBT2453172.1 sigma-70 family RNA polymerase sigma factor [Streptomyces sp. ISL-43]
MATDRHHPHPAEPGDDSAHLRWQRMWGHREQLLKVARRRSMSAEDAEDAVQEAMLRGAQHTHLDEARLGAWLTTVTMRLCVDRYRQVHREAQLSGTPKLTAPGPVPVDEAVCDRAEARWLAFRSRELPARQAEALRLKSQERDVGQIAREMGLSYEAVESLLARARRTLRNSLAGTLALGLWLIGRGRDQAGQAGQAGAHAPALAAASAAATLAMVGLALPFAYEPSAPVPPPPQMAVVREEPGAAGDRIPAASSVRPDVPGSVRPTGTVSPTALPGALPAVLPELPELPEVAATLPAAPDLPTPALTAPALPAPAVSVPPLPSTTPLPDSTTVPDLPGARSTRLP